MVGKAIQGVFEYFQHLADPTYLVGCLGHFLDLHDEQLYDIRGTIHAARREKFGVTNPEIRE